MGNLSCIKASRYPGGIFRLACRPGFKIEVFGKRFLVSSSIPNSAFVISHFTKFETWNRVLTTDFKSCKPVKLVPKMIWTGTKITGFSSWLIVGLQNLVPAGIRNLDPLSSYDFSHAVHRLRPPQRPNTYIHQILCLAYTSSWMLV